MDNAAIKYYSHGIQLSPDISELYYYRGISYQKKREFEKAINDFTEAIKLNPEEPSYYSIRGFIYKETGIIEKAKADFLKILKLEPENKMAKEFLVAIKNL